MRNEIHVRFIRTGKIKLSAQNPAQIIELEDLKKKKILANSRLVSGVEQVLITDGFSTRKCPPLPTICLPR